MWGEGLCVSNFGLDVNGVGVWIFWIGVVGSGEFLGFRFWDREVCVDEVKSIIYFGILGDGWGFDFCVWDRVVFIFCIIVMGRLLCKKELVLVWNLVFYCNCFVLIYCDLFVEIGLMWVVIFNWCIVWCVWGGRDCELMMVYRLGCGSSVCKEGSKRVEGMYFGCDEERVLSVGKRLCLCFLVVCFVWVWFFLEYELEVLFFIYFGMMVGLSFY